MANILYLDQNYISDLAKDAPEKPKYARLPDLHLRLISLVREGRLVVPESIFHHIESESAGNNLNLAIKKTINSLSQGHKFKDFTEILDLQIRNAMSDYFSQERVLIDPFCTPTTKRSLQQSVLQSSGFFKNEKEIYASRGEHIVRPLARKGSFDEQKNCEVRGMISYYFMEDKFSSCLSVYVIELYHYLHCGEPPPIPGVAMYSGFDPKFRKYNNFKNSDELKAVPFIDIVSSINTDITLQGDRKIKPSDYYDALIVGTILPYCNALATDHSMKSLLEKRRLDKKYGVKVFSKKKNEIENLLAYLEEIKES